MKYITRLEMENVADNLDRVRRRIRAACDRAGRPVEEVTVVAISKAFDSSYVHRIVEAGLVDIGESFVQELLRKRDAVEDKNIRWHFVGHLQTNKVKYLAGWIHLIHSVDSLRLAKEIDKHAGKSGRRLEVLVEVNTSGEATKFGVQPEEAPPLVQELSQYPHLHVGGLMTMGPLADDAEVSRPAFRTLRELRDTLQEQGFSLPHLSMGMTNDFEVAIEEGATIVRIGTAIFGSRDREQ